jgi:tetratricopeptide (TPR) repeat protein
LAGGGGADPPETPVTAGPDDAAELHDRAIEATERGRHAVARRLLRTALRRAPDPSRRARILITLSYQEAERHSLAAGIALLDTADAVPDLPPRLRGLVASQRGLLYMRAGQAADALAGLDAALGLLDESVPVDLCRALLNRGNVHLRRRTIAAARADFSACVDIATRHGLELLAAKASHNLGYLSMLAGDLPRALRQMDAVAPALGGLSPPMAAVYYVDRAQVLLTAGLLREADEDLGRAGELFRAAGLRQDRAEAELARAQVALLEERWADARRLARQARRRFVARGAGTWALLAEQATLSAEVASAVGARPGSPRLAAAATDAARLAGELSAAGLDDDARRAALTAALAALGGAGPAADSTVAGGAGPAADSTVAGGAGALGGPTPAGARALAGAATVLRRDDPVGTRLLARTVRSALADADGDPSRADAELRAALQELHRYQSSFGSIDLQTAVSGHGRRLAERGLARALATGRPAAVFGWAERARGLSTRLPPVVPPDDPEAARLLEELRGARAELRELTLARRATPALRARCADLERRVRQRSWYRPGPGQVTAPAALPALRAELAAADATLVAHLLSGGRVHALVATGRRGLVTDLGPATPFVELHHRLRADLDVLATGTVPAPIRASVRASTRTSLRRLDELLFGPVRAAMAGGPVLLAPSAGLATVPWTLLPTLYGRPATVVASATAWLANRRQAVLPAEPVVAFAVGPRVPRAADEADLVSREWPAVRVLAGGTATAVAVRDAAGAADILHVAAHGVHEPDNPLFSHLELADGPLFGHELDQLPRLPAHVVLSACELGLSGTRPGEESLGMTAALLHGGAGSVVAGVARIADAVACRTGAAHHAGLRSRMTPAAALASAISTGTGDREDPVPLVCFGAGW